MPSILERLLPDFVTDRRPELLKLVAMFLLFFLVVCAVGILRPIKNALALDGLGETDFYQVYLVSAAVVLFVPVFNRLADRVEWRWLIPGVALFFALNLLAFRALYREGSAAFGMAFYGWYDLFAAALVTQFFMATQLFFNARDAKKAYPLVIAGGSLGATLGGAVTGFFAQRVGTPNLLLVAAAVITVFGLALPFVWASEAADSGLRPAGDESGEKLSAGDLRTMFANPQVRLIAASVLLTVLAKQLVDYQFNTLSERAFESRDAVSAFQGKFNAATQWLPIVTLAALRPLLRRFGVGIAVLLFPAVILLTNAGLAIWYGIWAATVAKGLETSVRYSAERTAREILYVPVPEDIKLRAKTYIDVAVEKGLGKVLSAGLIFVLLQVVDFRAFPWVTMAVAGLLIGVAVAVRGEYVRTLARSIRGRFASLRGLFATVGDASTLPVLRRGLAEGDAGQLAFLLDLLQQADPEDVRPLAPELLALLDHDDAGIRAGALQVLSRIPSEVPEEALRRRLEDEAPEVREAAVGALCAPGREDREAILRDLLASDDAALRAATLRSLHRGGGVPPAAVAREFLEDRRPRLAAGDRDGRLEAALAAGALEDAEEAAGWLEPLVRDEDAEVAAAAIRGVGRIGHAGFDRELVAALGRPGTREAARAALAARGEAAVPLLEERLCDEREAPAVRRSIPSVLARIPERSTVEALLRSYAAPETDQLLDHRTLKALNKLRDRRPDLGFDREVVLGLASREVAAAARYAAALALLPESADGAPGEGAHREGAPGRGGGGGGSGERASRGGSAVGRQRALPLLRRALREAWSDRREAVFRCLGLVYAPEEVYRCYLAVVGGGRRSRANALEWLEQTVGHALYRRLEPVLGDAGEGGRAHRPEARELWARLRADNDRWIARCARVAAAELGVDGAADELGEGETVQLIEKVFLLQHVDLLEGARSGHLALLASIADELIADPGTALVRRGEPAEAMYVVIEGSVALEGMPEGTRLATAGDAFGTWALIDEAPSLVGARAEERTRLLRIRRRDFYDLLADHAEMSRDLLRGLARRVRSLAATVGAAPSGGGR